MLELSWPEGRTEIGAFPRFNHQFETERPVAPMKKTGGSRLVVVSNRVACPTAARAPAAWKSRSAPALRRAAASGSAGAARSPMQPAAAQHRRARRTSPTSPSTSRKDDYQEFYNGFANRVLWPILHYRLDLAEFSRRDLGGYLRVNEHFARKLEKLLRPDDVIWVHDYHLIPLAKALRERGHKNRIGFFLHIPCPPPEILTALPNHERLIPALVPLRSGRLPDRRRRLQFLAAISPTNAGCRRVDGGSFAIDGRDGARSASFRSASRPRPSQRLARRAIEIRLRAAKCSTAWPAAP